MKAKLFNWTRQQTFVNLHEARFSRPSPFLLSCHQGPNSIRDPWTNFLCAQVPKVETLTQALKLPRQAQNSWTSTNIMQWLLIPKTTVMRCSLSFRHERVRSLWRAINCLSGSVSVTFKPDDLDRLFRDVSLLQLTPEFKFSVTETPQALVERTCEKNGHD